MGWQSIAAGILAFTMSACATPQKGALKDIFDNGPTQIQKNDKGCRFIDQVGDENDDDKPKPCIPS